MKVNEQTKTIKVSRRNLLSLLTKLDGKPQNSACTLAGGDDAVGWFLIAEEDAVHYAERSAGRMHAETEEALKLPCY